MIYLPAQCVHLHPLLHVFQFTSQAKKSICVLLVVARLMVSLLFRSYFLEKWHSFGGEYNASAIAKRCFSSKSCISGVSMILALFLVFSNIDQVRSRQTPARLDVSPLHRAHGALGSCLWVCSFPLQWVNIQIFLFKSKRPPFSYWINVLYTGGRWGPKRWATNIFESVAGGFLLKGGGNGEQNVFSKVCSGTRKRDVISACGSKRPIKESGVIFFSVFLLRSVRQSNKNSNKVRYHGREVVVIMAGKACGFSCVCSFCWRLLDLR